MIKKVIGSIILLIIAVSIIGSMAGGSSDKSKATAGSDNSSSDAAVGPKVSGHVKNSLFVSGDKEAIGKVKFTQYWCRWNDGQVEVHVVVKNPMAAHVTVHLQPNYRLANAGLHGDGISSQEDIGVDASATRDWSARIGSASGVNGTPTITECSPELNDIELG